MKNFEDYFEIGFLQTYLEYCKRIHENIISAWYDIQFLENLGDHKKWHSYFEKPAYFLLKHIITVIWSDLILSTTKLLEGGNGVLSITKFKSDIKNNLKKNMDYKFTAKIPSITKIFGIRHESIAHSLDQSTICVDLNEIKDVLIKIIDCYNELSFQHSENNYIITDKDLSTIATRCRLGINQLFNMSKFV